MTSNNWVSTTEGGQRMRMECEHRPSWICECQAIRERQRIKAEIEKIGNSPIPEKKVKKLTSGKDIGFFITYEELAEVFK